jgi:hypothetical protein
MNAMQSASRSLTASPRGSIVASTGRTTLTTRWEAWIPVEGELVDGAGDLREAGGLRSGHQHVVGGKVLRLKSSDVDALVVPADQCRKW